MSCGFLVKMDKKEVLKRCKVEGFFLDRDMLDFFVGLDEENFVFLLNKLKNLGINEKILTKKIFDKNKNKINCFFGEKKENRVKILKNFEKKNKKVTNLDFFEYFRNRFEILRDILVKRGIDNLISIRRIGFNNGNYSVVGMIYSKRVTKNKNLLFEIEDLGGRIMVLVNRENKELFARAEKLVEDDVLCFMVSGSSRMLFVNDFVFPDFCEMKENCSNKDEYCAFISDFHIGSKLFLEDNLRKFVGWLNGEIGDERQKVLAKKVRYLFLVGDLVEGVGIFPGQEKFLRIGDYKGQYKKLFSIFENLRDDVEVVVCPGLHDAVWLGEVQPEIDEKWVMDFKCLKNFRFVSNPCVVDINSVKIMINYGINLKSFFSKFEKGSGFDILDEILKRRSLPLVYGESDFVPEDSGDFVLDEDLDVLVVGGRHKVDIGYYKNVLKISTSCFVEKGDFEMRNGLDVDFARVPILNLKSKEVKILDFSKRDDSKGLDVSEVKWEEGEGLVCELGVGNG